MQQTTQSDWIRDAEQRRDVGISRATTHAERVSDGWNARADGALLSFLIERCGVEFLAEEFRKYATERFGLLPPPDARAWGGPIRRAALAGKIVKVGARPAATSNCSLKPLWRERRA